MTDLLTSITRTIVPTIIGWVVAGFALVGISIPENVQGWLSGVIVFLVALVWYVVVRWLEKRWPKLGFLLGVPKQPVYSTASATTADPAVITSATDVQAAIDAGPPADLTDTEHEADVQAAASRPAK